MRMLTWEGIEFGIFNFLPLFICEISLLKILCRRTFRVWFRNLANITQKRTYSEMGKVELNFVLLNGVCSRGCSR